MRCAECAGEFERKLIIYHQLWGDELYRFENVLALVCSQCGAIYLEAKISQMIDEIIESKQKPERFERVPVFSLSQEIV